MADSDLGGDPGVPIRELLSGPLVTLQLTLRAGAAGLDRRISQTRIQKAALAVSGYVNAIHPGRVQVLGASEIEYLRSRPGRRREVVFRNICRVSVACFVITKGLEPPIELLDAAEAAAIPVLTTPLASSAFIDAVQRYLDDRLAPRTTVHGNLIDVYGLGVLLMGQSGIGKSECALDLITRGHRLVCDDVVEVRREGRTVVGAGPELTRYHMEIRGLGLLNVRDLFGISAIRSTKFIEMVVLLEPWREGKAYDRLGLDEATYAILQVELPLVRMPVAPGRNLAILIEVAARNQLLKMRGIYGARWFVDRVTREMDARNKEIERPVESIAATHLAPSAETAPANRQVSDEDEEPPPL